MDIKRSILTWKENVRKEAFKAVSCMTRSVLHVILHLKYIEVKKRHKRLDSADPKRNPLMEACHVVKQNSLDTKRTAFKYKVLRIQKGRP